MICAVQHTAVHHLDDCLLFKPHFRCDQIQDGVNMKKANGKSLYPACSFCFFDSYMQICCNIET